MAKSKEPKATMLITQALNELKLLDKKISKKTSQVAFVGVQVSGTARQGFDADKAKAELQSLTDMIARRETIRGLINASNFKTKVTIAGKKYTVAEAITTKDTMKYKAELLRYLTRSYSGAVNTVDAINDEVKRELDNQLKGVEDKAKIKTFSDGYLELHTASLADPINASATIDALTDEIDDFMNEVDYVLSTSNATTSIEV